MSAVLVQQVSGAQVQGGQGGGGGRGQYGGARGGVAEGGAVQYGAAAQVLDALFRRLGVDVKYPAEQGG
jgi:hypothetical protein